MVTQKSLLQAQQLTQQYARQHQPKHDVLRLQAFYKGGLLKGYKFKDNIRAASDPVESDESDDEVAKRVRAELKDKGVPVPPRISIEKLLDLAIKHGVEV